MNYQRHYNLLIEKARNRVSDVYAETHHIIPRCIGGGDTADNLVKLTPEEHFVAHQILIRIYPNQPKLVMAARYMCGEITSNRGRKFMINRIKSNEYPDCYYL